MAVDRTGIIFEARAGLNESKRILAGFTNQRQRRGSLDDALTGVDVLIGVSGPDLVSAKQIGLMNRDAIVFALSNPTPEIMPDVARAGGAAVVATGRSDFANQVNNALVFPGIFKGALEREVRSITPKMMIAAAEALAGLVQNPTSDNVIPSIFDERVVETVASSIK